eukprot:scaffold524_cov183-Alexandrium_tamarense.AAC.20
MKRLSDLIPLKYVLPPGGRKEHFTLDPLIRYAVDTSRLRNYQTEQDDNLFIEEFESPSLPFKRVTATQMLWSRIYFVCIRSFTSINTRIGRLLLSVLSSSC